MPLVAVYRANIHPADVSLPAVNDDTLPVVAGQPRIGVRPHPHLGARFEIGFNVVWPTENRAARLNRRQVSPANRDPSSSINTRTRTDADRSLRTSAIRTEKSSVAKMYTIRSTLCRAFSIGLNERREKLAAINEQLHPPLIALGGHQAVQFLFPVRQVHAWPRIERRRRPAGIPDPYPHGHARIAEVPQAAADQREWILDGGIARLWTSSEFKTAR